MSSRKRKEQGGEAHRPSKKEKSGEGETSTKVTPAEQEVKTKASVVARVEEAPVSEAKAKRNPVKKRRGDALCEAWQRGWRAAPYTIKEGISRQVYLEGHEYTVKEIDNIVAGFTSYPSTKKVIDLSNLTFVPFDMVEQIGTSSAPQSDVTRNWILYNGNEAALKKLSSFVKCDNTFGRLYLGRKLTLSEVDILVRHGSTPEVALRHRKWFGRLILPKSLDTRQRPAGRLHLSECVANPFQWLPSYSHTHPYGSDDICHSDDEN